MANGPVLVVDFGAQYAQLIARRVREAGVYSELVPHSMPVDEILAKDPKAIILSGGPASVFEPGAPTIDTKVFESGVPVLGICYGFQVMAYELGGKALGMIGCGRISQLAMQKCKYGFGMKVIGYDPYMTQEKIGDLCELKATAKEVWEQADFVSVHLPVVPSTEHSIGREQFSWMKPTASFINCARGALIKENELVECLKDGTLFQAGLDVFEHEPIQESSRALFDLDNVIMTPHMAATTEQSVLNCCTSVANDIVAVCNGQEPQVKAQKPKF